MNTLIENIKELISDINTAFLLYRRARRYSLAARDNKRRVLRDMMYAKS